MIEPSMPDAELLNRYKSTGDEAAFRALVKKYAGLVFGIALRRTGSHSQAEEAAQNVFIILARKVDRLRAAPSLSAWLYRCTLIETAELLRRHRAHDRKMEAFGEQTRHAGGRDIWSEVLPLLDESIHALRTADRTLIWL